jgi:hypothetical protein
MPSRRTKVRRSRGPRRDRACTHASPKRELGEAQRLMEEQINLYPQIQEFQALGLA